MNRTTLRSVLAAAVALAGVAAALQAPLRYQQQAGSPLERGRVWLVGADSATITMPSIQAAVDAAEDGDTILLSSGLFVGTGNRGVLVRDKNVTIRGTSTSILDCQGIEQGFWFDGPAVDERTVLHGVWIRNGYSLSHPVNGSGGGVLVTNGAHPVIAESTFEACREHGIAYFYDNQGILPLGKVQDCVFLGNRSDGDGGGFWGGAVVVERCVFVGNTAGIGGGAARITHTLRDSLIVGNAATDLVNGGGGVKTWPNATIEGCTFAGNTANFGGGVNMFPGTTVISNCIFWGNTAVFDGQQIYQGAPTLGSTATVIRYCDVQGGADGIETSSLLSNGPLLQHLLDADPQFLDPGRGDYGLAPSSPCRDAGDPDLVPAGRGDLELQPRRADGRIDMGADETWETFVLGLVSPGIAGLPNRIRADNAPPGALVAFLWGTSAGLVPLPLVPCPDLALAIADPELLVQTVADPSGSAAYGQRIPAAASGATVLLQALFLVPGSACGASNLVTHTYP